MSLPHFTNMSRHHYVEDPIYINQYEVNFDNKYLMESCYSIEDDIMKFNLNLNENLELQPFEYINNMINNNINIKYLEIKNHSRTGDVLYCVFLKNFSFIKTDILNFDWSEIDIKHLKVKFKYDDIKVVTAKNYNNFIRKVKLENIIKETES